MFEMIRVITEQEKRIAKFKYVVMIAFINALATMFLMFAGFYSLRIGSGLYGFLGGWVVVAVLVFQYARFVQEIIAWYRTLEVSY